MREKMQQVLQNKFGFNSFRKGQAEAIETILSGQDSLVMLPTGTGKSLCYQLPAYLKNGTTLIISPLLSLMQDQVEQIKLRGEKRVVAINSLTPHSERNRIYKQLSKYRFVYTSPEMLQNSELLEHLKKIHVNYFIVDEAHCISHWGTDFRPDYLVLADVRKALNSPPTMALTATATERVRKEIIDFLDMDIHSTKQIIQSVDRPEIKYVVEVCNGDKFEKLLYTIQQINGPGIIYFTSKKLADQVAEKLRVEHQVSAESYHSDIEADDKAKIQQQFLQNNFQVVCATSAFGMGFDKKDIRFVIHYHLPASPEMYLQEVGRASRDGMDSIAILLYQNGDESIQKNFIEESLPTRDDLLWAQKNKQKVPYTRDAILKLADYFMESSNDINKALENIKVRQTIKYKQLKSMLEYIYTPSCKRGYLLDYFEESLSEQPAICCSNCQFDLEHFMHSLEISQTFKENTPLVTDWAIQFKQFYNI